METPTWVEAEWQRAIAACDGLPVGSERVRAYCWYFAWCRWHDLMAEAGRQHEAREAATGEALAYGMRPEHGRANPDAARRIGGQGRRTRQRLGAKASAIHRALGDLAQALADAEVVIDPGRNGRCRGDWLERLKAMRAEFLGFGLQTWHSAAASMAAKLAGPPLVADRRAAFAHEMLLTWHTHIPRYRGRWEDMFAVAQRLGVALGGDHLSFKRSVLRLAQRVTPIKPTLPHPTT